MTKSRHCRGINRVFLNDKITPLAKTEWPQSRNIWRGRRVSSLLQPGVNYRPNVRLIPSCARACVRVRACGVRVCPAIIYIAWSTGVWTMANHWADEDLQRPNPAVVKRCRAYRMNIEWILSAFETTVITVRLCSFNLMFSRYLWCYIISTTTAQRF